MAVYISIRILLYILLPKQLTGNTGFTEFSLRIPKVIDQLLQPVRIMRYTIIAISFISKCFIVWFLLATRRSCIQ